MISKELLSEVLGREIVRCWTTKDSPKTYIEYETGINTKNAINIYELAHKCKEWALTNGYSILSGFDEGELACYLDVKFIYEDDGERIRTDWDIEKEFGGNTEPEAIFKACEWIMEQKNDM